MLPNLFHEAQLLRLHPVYPRYRDRMPPQYVMFSHWAMHPSARIEDPSSPEGYRVAHWALQTIHGPQASGWMYDSGIPEVVHQLGLVIDGIVGEYNVNAQPSFALWGDRIYNEEHVIVIVPEWTDRWGTGLMLVTPES